MAVVCTTCALLSVGSMCAVDSSARQKVDMRLMASSSYLA